MIELGSKVTDKITGYTGIATGYVVYISGCNQYLVARKVKQDGASMDSLWLDEQRLEVDTSFDPIVLDNSRTQGADIAPPRR